MKTRRSSIKAQDIMTSDVATVTPDTSIRDIASLMMEKRISGVPVAGDDGRIVGIVRESDLLHRAEVGTERKHKWWFRVFADPMRLHESTRRPMVWQRATSCPRGHHLAPRSGAGAWFRSPRRPRR
jgi:CBS-domain-containing membrane protein